MRKAIGEKAMLQMRCIWVIGLMIGCIGSLSAQVAPEALSMQAVSDYSGLLSQEEASTLSKRIISYYDSTSVQIAIALIPSAYLGDYSAEMYANTLARHWGLGTKEDHSGLLILVVGKPGESNRKLRFEVGYGLEPVLTDVRCFRIQQAVMVPQLKQGNYYQALWEGLDAVMETIKFGELPFDLAPPPPSYSEKRELAKQQIAEESRRYSLVGKSLLGLSFVIWLSSVIVRRVRLKDLKEELGLKKKSRFADTYNAVLLRVKQGQNDQKPNKQQDKLLTALLRRAYNKGFKEEYTNMYQAYKKGKSLQQRALALFSSLPKDAWRHWQALLISYAGMGMLMWGTIHNPQGLSDFFTISVLPVIFMISFILFLAFGFAKRNDGKGGGGSYTYSSSGTSYSSSSSSGGYSSSYSSGSSSYDSGSSYSGGGGDFGGGGATSDW